MKCTVYPHANECNEVGTLTMELSSSFFGCLKVEFSGERTDLIEWIAMIFHIDDFEIQTYVFNSESSTFTSGIMYQISETELTDYLPQRTAHPRMATMVTVWKQLDTIEVIQVFTCFCFVLFSFFVENCLEGTFSTVPDFSRTNI